MLPCTQELESLKWDTVGKLADIEAAVEVHLDMVVRRSLDMVSGRGTGQKTTSGGRSLESTQTMPDVHITAPSLNDLCVERSLLSRGSASTKGSHRGPTAGLPVDESFLLAETLGEGAGRQGISALLAESWVAQGEGGMALAAKTRLSSSSPRKPAASPSVPASEGGGVEGTVVQLNASTQVPVGPDMARLSLDFTSAYEREQKRKNKKGVAVPKPFNLTESPRQSIAKDKFEAYMAEKQAEEDLHMNYRP